MNDSLINAHRGQLKHPLAVQLYDAMLADAVKNPETDTMQVELILHNIAILEDQKQALLLDIQTRGVNVPFQQGKQKMFMENKSVGMLNKVTEQQKRLLVEMNGTPRSAKISRAKDAGKPDTLDDFD